MTNRKTHTYTHTNTHDWNMNESNVTKWLSMVSFVAGQFLSVCFKNSAMEFTKRSPIGDTNYCIIERAHSLLWSGWWWWWLRDGEFMLNIKNEEEWEKERKKERKQTILTIT